MSDADDDDDDCEDVDDDDVGQGRSLSRIRHQVGNLDPTAQFNETPFVVCTRSIGA